jgi:pimeloyl-ACP methyl ester carboxylesterase
VELARAADGQGLALAEVRLPGATRAPGPGELAFLLLHGFAQNRRGFALGPMPRALLERGARVFLGELRGHGASRVAPGRPWSLATHLELDLPALLEAVRRRAGAERVHLVGHSMGGLLGCALLAREAPLASLTAAATPLVLAASRPLLRLASLLLGPALTLAPQPERVPIERVLRALSGPLSRPDARGPLRLLQRLAGLANPRAASPGAVAAILASADPESPAVFEELARQTAQRRPLLAGVDLLRAVRESPLPVAAIVGGADAIAPRATVAGLEGRGHAGPRRIVEIPGAGHVDVIMGEHVPATLASIWDFLVAGG